MSAHTFFAWRMFATAKSQDDCYYSSSIRARARAVCDPLDDLTNNEFKKRYRLSKKAFKFLCKELRCLTNLRSSQRVSLETKVLTALFFYASGSYQRPVGVARNVSQKMCSVYIEEVTEALIHKHMMHKYIKFPDTLAARQAISHRFYNKYKLPGIIGCIDGTHIKIFAPHKEMEHWYYCRKHYHSLNVQMVCDDEYRILNVNAKFGGANHDAFIWDNSFVNTYMQQLHCNGETVWLLGDSGYPQRPWLMTPILGATPGTAEATYNDRHCAARVVIENTFGKLKNRWRCINKDRVLHYKPLKCAKIVQACCILHNFCIACGTSEIEYEYDIGGVDNEEQSDMEGQENQRRDGGSTTDLIRGRVLRDQLVRRIQED